MVMQSRSRRLTALAVSTAVWGLLATSAIAEEYIIKFKNAGAADVAFSSKSVEGFEVNEIHRPGQLISVTSNEKDGLLHTQKVATILQRDDVEYMVKNFKLKTLSQPNDPHFGQQWALKKVRATEAWNTTVGSRAVTVAVIDTGVDVAHEDLKANIWINPNEIPGNGVDDDNNGYVDDIHGYDFLDNDADPSDVTSAQNPGHGTHCAGIVGAVGNNGQGISGMSQQVSLIGLRFIGPNGQGDLMGAIKAIDYAIAAKADVISASWGAAVSASQAQPLIEAVQRASDANVTFVAAAANDGANNDSKDMYPANVEADNLIAVAASDNSDGKPSWSNFGKAKVHLASPGADIYSTTPSGKYQNLSGTSMATPLVAGLVALLKSQEQALGTKRTGQELRSILQVTGAKVAIETACGCRVDAKAAIDHLNANALTVSPAATTLAPNGTGSVSAFGGSGQGYTFASANPAVVEVSGTTVTAKAEGETTITVTDSEGNQAQSLNFRVANPPEGGGTEECPLGDPMMCELMCALDPTLPWCAK